MSQSPDKNHALWNHDEWERMRSTLERLSLEQIKLLAARTGIEFDGGIDSLKDRQAWTVKDQIIAVLDEVLPAALIREYEQICKGR